MGTESTNSDEQQMTFMKERKLAVGIYSEPTVNFILNGVYLFDGREFSGQQTAVAQDGKVLFEGKLYEELLFTGSDATDNHFTLKGVTIGVNFHWQRREDQSFKGDLRIICGHDHVLSDSPGLIAINLIDVEDSLTSVISSEMAATSSMELLKAHAVISRSWLLHPIINPHTGGNHQTSIQTDDTIIRWYERDAHTLFDVCADDHCQRYQGITKQTSANVEKAIDATRGLVLRSKTNNEICDARFYKCCGGKTEEFETCWADEHYSYLESVDDPYCDTNDTRILQQVLNNYDQETPDFHDWTVRYTQEELSNLIKEKSGIDFGEVQDLIPVKRGPSGRIFELKIVGSKRTMAVGKELEIRKWLSKSHLYSSWFDVEKSQNGGQMLFTLRGHGWGHGVGLCQIGAAVMADKGFGYEDILAHYFPNTYLKPLD